MPRSKLYKPNSGYADYTTTPKVSYNAVPYTYDDYAMQQDNDENERDEENTIENQQEPEECSRRKFEILKRHFDRNAQQAAKFYYENHDMINQTPPKFLAANLKLISQEGPVTNAKFCASIGMKITTRSVKQRKQHTQSKPGFYVQYRNGNVQQIHNNEYNLAQGTNNIRKFIFNDGTSEQNINKECFNKEFLSQTQIKAILSSIPKWICPQTVRYMGRQTAIKIAHNHEMSKICAIKPSSIKTFENKINHNIKTIQAKKPIIENRRTHTNTNICIEITSDKVFANMTSYVPLIYHAINTEADNQDHIDEIIKHNKLAENTNTTDKRFKRKQLTIMTVPPQTFTINRAKYDKIAKLIETENIPGYFLERDSMMYTLKTSKYNIMSQTDTPTTTFNTNVTLNTYDLRALMKISNEIKANYSDFPTHNTYNILNHPEQTHFTKISNNKSTHNQQNLTTLQPKPRSNHPESKSNQPDQPEHKYHVNHIPNCLTTQVKIENSIKNTTNSSQYITANNTNSRAQFLTLMSRNHTPLPTTSRCPIPQPTRITPIVDPDQELD